MMSDQSAPLQQPYGRAYEHLLEKVRYEGAYPTREKAEEAVRLVLAGLGRQLTSDERVELADTGSVFSAVAAYAGPDLITRILRLHVAGYALLFGRAELTPAA
ncbi:DUF2267 domain-containing protein [Streptomyces sp. NPDC056112]|uniref:DUF2267 domain-containing protein n=1 Tax=Streptomyces sp. NPDC056112 TaxID=3345715 RepID=UPI0035DAAB88